MGNIFFRRNISVLFFIASAFVFMHTRVQAQITYDNYLPKTGIVPGAVLTVADPNTDQAGTDLYLRRNQFVSLTYTTEALTDVADYTAWSYELVVKIMNGADTSQYFNDTLAIRRNDSLPQYRALNYYNLPWRSLRVRVVSVCAKTGADLTCLTDPHLYPLIPEDIELSAAVLRTEINGFGALTDASGGTGHEYDPGEVPADCEIQYNQRLQDIRDRYDALLQQRMTDWAAAAPANLTLMGQADQLIRTHSETRLARMTDTLMRADRLYFKACDSLIPDTFMQARLLQVTQTTLDDYLYLPYFRSFDQTALHFYRGQPSLYRDAIVQDSTHFAGFFFDANTRRLTEVSGTVTATLPPSFNGCYLGSYGDTANRWPARALHLMLGMYGVRDSVLGAKGLTGTQYLTYRGARAELEQQTDGELRAEVNRLNEEMFSYCGYNGQFQGDCKTYYNALLSAGKARQAALTDSVADTTARRYGISKNLLTQTNTIAKDAVNALLTGYNHVLDSLDWKWALCGADSSEMFAVYNAIQPLSRNAGYLPSAFLKSRQLVMEQRYARRGVPPDSTDWVHITDSLLYAYRDEGGALAAAKQALLNGKFPHLSPCFAATYTAHKLACTGATQDLLAQTTPAIDAAGAYAPVTVYRYEKAQAQWLTDVQNDPAYRAALEAEKALMAESARKCGTETTPPEESYFACLARTENDIRLLNIQKQQFIGAIDGMTQAFRGIARPGGWNESNGDIRLLTDGLLAQYRYRLDTLLPFLLGSCLDSTQLAAAKAQLAADPTPEQTYYDLYFKTPYNALIPIQDDPLGYVNTHFTEITDALPGVFFTYLGMRTGQKFSHVSLPSLGLDSAQGACIQGLFTGTNPLLPVFGDFMTDFYAYLDAGAAGITTDTDAYRESVLYYSFMRNMADMNYTARLEQVTDDRSRCTLYRPEEPEGTTAPKPPTVSLDAEIAACQADLQAQLQALFEQSNRDQVQLIATLFGPDTARGFDPASLTDWLNHIYTELIPSTLWPVDSAWLSCNPAPVPVQLKTALAQPDLLMDATMDNAPYYLTDLNYLYHGGVPTRPDYGHLPAFRQSDSTLYLQLAQNRVLRARLLMETEPGTYGLPDSCIYTRTDSAARQQYTGAYALWAAGIQQAIDAVKAAYGPAVIDADSLEMKLRWLPTAAQRLNYLFILQYRDLQAQYAACSAPASYIRWTPGDPEPNAEKKRTINTVPVSAVDRMPLWPILPTVMDLTTSPVTVVTESGPCGITRHLQWTPIAQALEYDLEWAYIDNETFINGQRANNLADIKYRAFALTEPTRVTVKENRYPFPEEYPNGKLYFRVRGVARVIDHVNLSYDQPQFFPWVFNWSGYRVTSSPVDFNGNNPFNDTYENNLNWQWEASFAEEGKYKRVISYHDGLNRPRQVVTHLSTDKLSVVGETLYDHEGRAAVQVLPYPEPCQELSYRHETRSDMAGGAFDKSDFELDAGQPGMNTVYGASAYYSPENPFTAVENPLMHMGAVPDAQHYPYTQTAFMRDNTGRPLASGGVGPDHALHAGHDTRYFYANASETELRSLFGKNVGRASHYKKNAVLDANRQLSVAYVDQEGRSVATALAGAPPANVLPLESNRPRTITQDLTEHNLYDPVARTWRVSYTQLNETPNNTYGFTYEYGLDRLFPDGTPPCILCEFDLEIYVTDPDGNPVPLQNVAENGGTPVGSLDKFTKRLDNVNAYGLANPCNNLSEPRQVTFTVTLPEVNTYTIHKNLTWDADAAMNAIRSAAQPGINAQTGAVLTSLTQQYLSQIDSTQCNLVPGTGFGAIPTDLPGQAPFSANTTQCESYLTQMIDQIVPWAGPGVSPVPNTGRLFGDAPFWNRVKDRIQAGMDTPGSPNGISAAVLGAYRNADATVTVSNLKNDPAHWSWELKKELAKSHPEYCWYTKCMDYARSVPFDAEMAQKTDLADGVRYRNPQNQAGTGPSLIFSTTGTPIQDPVQNAVIKDKVLHAGSYHDQTIWEIAQSVRNSFTPEPGQTQTATQAAWHAYRGGYLQAKSDAFYEAVSTCPYQLPDSTAVVKKPPFMPTTEETMNQGNAAAAGWLNLGGALCTDVCRQNAAAWASQLFANCAEPTGNSADLRVSEVTAYLEQYCLGQCNPSNPFGIITQDMLNQAMASGPGDTRYPLRQAVELYNQIAGSGTAGGGCQTITSTGGVWSAPFSLGEGGYIEQCTPVRPAFTTRYIVMDMIAKINAAYTAMGNNPGAVFSIPPFVSSGGSTISVTNTLTPAWMTDCLPLTVGPCALRQAQDGPDPDHPECTEGCNVQFFAARERGGGTVYIPLRPLELRRIIINGSTQGLINFDASGNVTVPVSYERWSVTESGGTYTYGTQLLPNETGYMQFNLANCCSGNICRILPQPWDSIIDPDRWKIDCLTFLTEQAHESAQNEFDTWLDNYINEQWKKADCRINETLRCTYTKSEYHYTLYYYDQAGNLVQTVPPKGVHPLDTEGPAFRTGRWTGTTQPQHDMESRYKFNSLEVAVQSETPDGGLTRYKPDLMGRPDESRNRQQTAEALLAYSQTGRPTDIFSKTAYDGLGRITAVYQQKNVTPASGPVVQTQSQITLTLYDSPASIYLTSPSTGSPSTGSGGQVWQGKNTRARVASTVYFEEPGTMRHGTYYSYDIHGNVKSLVTDVPALDDFGQRFHQTDYYYDLVSGKVNEVHYQAGKPDRIYYRYAYDADNRLVTAETSKDYVSWERDAKYFYYPHGPLKRTETGHRKVQGTDYFYTVQGWLKGVNAGALNETHDLGHDGDAAPAQNPNRLVARDAYGFTLDYFNGDYKPVGGTSMAQVPAQTGSAFESAVLQQGLYNGNIVRMTTALASPSPSPSPSTGSGGSGGSGQARLPVLGFAYKYDQLNRIRENNAYLSSDMHTANSWSGITGTDAYKGSYTYDANGNLLTLQRRGAAGTLKDDFTYEYRQLPYSPGNPFSNYIGPQNRLDRVQDAVPDGDFPDDMDSQAAGNYAYDAIGNLVKDTKEEIAEIKWTVYGKVSSVTRTAGSKKPDLNFYYDAAGRRYMKVVRPKDQSTGAALGKHDWKVTYYQHDAQGNVLAVYNIKGGPSNCGYEMYLGEHTLYGSSRLGTATYKNLYLGYSGNSLAYPKVSGIYVCYKDQDEVNLPLQPVDGNIIRTPGGKLEATASVNIALEGIGDTRRPVTGIRTVTVVNLPVNLTPPVKLPTAFNPGTKRYEFTNHLGNVLATVSDIPLGIDVDHNGIADHYLAQVTSVSDYEPFGAPLEDRTLTAPGRTSCLRVDSLRTDDYDHDFTSSVHSWVHLGEEPVQTDNGRLAMANYGHAQGETFFINLPFLETQTGKHYHYSFDIDMDACGLDSVLFMPTGSEAHSLKITASGHRSGSLYMDESPASPAFILYGTDSCTVYLDNFRLWHYRDTSYTDCTNLSAQAYRYGFNGQEKDDEVYGEGNSYTAEFWQYDPRTGRRWNVDPMTGSFPWQSPYAAFDDNPILNCDPTGLAAEGGEGPGQGAARGVAGTLRNRINSVAAEASKPIVPYAPSSKQVLTAAATTAGLENLPAAQVGIGAGAGMGTVLDAYNGVAQRANNIAENPLRAISIVDVAFGVTDFVKGAPAAAQEIYNKLSDGDPSTIAEVSVIAIKTGLGAYIGIRSIATEPAVKTMTAAETATETGAAKGGMNLTKSQLKSISSLESQIATHETKLAEYIKDPMKFDNKDFLKNAPNDAVRQKIIQSRINHLNQEIKTFKNNIQKIINGQ